MFLKPCKIVYLILPLRESSYDAYFVDLFVRVSNTVALQLYEKLGYTVYRRVLGYYSGEEDAFGMLPPIFSDKLTSGKILLYPLVLARLC